MNIRRKVKSFYFDGKEYNDKTLNNFYKKIKPIENLLENEIELRSKLEETVQASLSHLINDKLVSRVVEHLAEPESKKPTHAAVRKAYRDLIVEYYTVWLKSEKEAEDSDIQDDEDLE